VLQQAGYQEVPYWLAQDHYLRHMPLETHHSIYESFILIEIYFRKELEAICFDMEKQHVFCEVWAQLLNAIERNWSPAC
jgi:hypothetical protein